MDYIFIPINVRVHWFLAVVCFPGADRKVCTLNELPPPPPPRQDEGESEEQRKQGMKDRSDQVESNFLSWLGSGTSSAAAAGRVDSDDRGVSEETNHDEFILHSSFPTSSGTDGARYHLGKTCHAGDTGPATDAASGDEGSEDRRDREGSMITTATSEDKRCTDSGSGGRGKPPPHSPAQTLAELALNPTSSTSKKRGRPVGTNKTPKPSPIPDGMLTTAKKKRDDAETQHAISTSPGGNCVGFFAATTTTAAAAEVARGEKQAAWESTLGNEVQEQDRPHGVDPRVKAAIAAISFKNLCHSDSNGLIITAASDSQTRMEDPVDMDQSSHCVEQQGRSFAELIKGDQKNDNGSSHHHSSSSSLSHFSGAISDSIGNSSDSIEVQQLSSTSPPFHGDESQVLRQHVREGAALILLDVGEKHSREAMTGENQIIHVSSSPLSTHLPYHIEGSGCSTIDTATAATSRSKPRRKQTHSEKKKAQLGSEQLSPILIPTPTASRSRSSNVFTASPIPLCISHAAAAAAAVSPLSSSSSSDIHNISHSSDAASYNKTNNDNKNDKNDHSASNHNRNIDPVLIESTEKGSNPQPSSASSANRPRRASASGKKSAGPKAKNQLLGSEEKERMKRHQIPCILVFDSARVDRSRAITPIRK